jgi:alkaline phosphatase D
MSDRRGGPIDRRAFLLASGAAAAGVVLSGTGAAAGPTGPAGSVGSGRPVAPIRDPFQLGVASGDPWPRSVVLWTRLAPHPLVPGGGMPARDVPVSWQLAADKRFREVVRRGTALARPAGAHAVHVTVDGLEPGRWYWYRFKVGHEVSPAGRTRTAPSPLSHDPVRFAFASCQDWQDGFYTAYRHLVSEDLDVVVFLGDYIYENGPASDAVRAHDGDGEPETLDEYRARYALYKTDPDLQAAHAAFPWAATFDDHEVDNDWSADVPQDPDAQPREQFLARRAAAFQAYYEHLPLRAAQRPSGPSVLMYRRLRFGSLLEMNVLDTRQYRSLTEPCGYGTGPACPEVFDPARTMLGAEQEAWLTRGLRSSTVTWDVVAQQVPVARIDVGSTEPEYKLDKWDAYPVARQRLLDLFGSRHVTNPVVITGDLHDSWVADLKANFDEPASPVVGTELIGTSISSDRDGAEASEDGLVAMPRNPHLKFHNYRRGYVRCAVTEDSWQTDFRTVPFVTTPGAPIETKASFVIESGRPGALPV